MSASIVLSSQPKKPFHHRNGSYELDVFEATGYFSGATENFSGTHKNTSREANIFYNSKQKYNMKPIRRMSLDMPNHRGNSSPLQAKFIENPTMMITKEKKFKQPSSPGGKLAHFLNSLFNQTSSKKSKSKKKSTKDEDESPGGWKRKRRSSISHFRSENSNSTSTATITTTTPGTTTIMSYDKSFFSTSTSSGFRTPPPYHQPHTPTKTTSYPISFSFLKSPSSQITKIPITENLNKIENFNIKSDSPEKKMGFRNGFVEKVKILDPREDIKEFKKFNDDDDNGADSDSSSDLFELTNCDLGYYSSELPVYKTTHMDDSIKT